ncbi:MAG: minichromosome maintenance protein MCM [Methanosphaera sp.]|uniref:minichromosome maintenance protein MCM n=1 Tax=Methanosphaera sp. TaxID=2666342 RepID=UPI0025F05D28|nr:minichromosome maintenance protein MCM [Methanosphaera sp.]MCI5867783.1 minichromosome maintenance protein MCM [Methanosphaera sp.]MDD6535258.1 minichromosome maintenance protein MCM [Methanosphaera sp.]MDY3956419.1 minichromosome maintenance protein MCM [Methanosphaera sp.]
MESRVDNKKINTVQITNLEEFFSTSCKDEIFAALDLFPDEKSVIIDYNDLEMFNPDIADALLAKPNETLEVATDAIINIDPQRRDIGLNVRFKNVRNVVHLRNLKSEYIGKFIAVDGIIRKTDTIHPRIQTAVFKCRSCGRIHEVKQKTNLIFEPAACSECGSRSFEIIEDESTFMDTQTVKLQEPLENLSGGDQPRQINVVLEDDMVDTLTPGDKVRITGILKTQRDDKTKRYNNYIYGNYIEHLEQEFEELHISEEDEKEIIALSKQPDIYEQIIASTAPSIQGYDEVKEAIAFQLFGGTAKVLEDKTHIRGDMHVLIVGDPGIGKSQILKYVSKLAPRGIYTSGKGTSGVGLTAAAVRDDLGGWSLEAGALVLGDKGNVCVDELDKMREEDRSAIHEALEQQTISIAKAGIMATLNSRCSVLAAANPKFGRFDRYKSIPEQIELPPPILSRFDLIFIVEDKPNAERDHKLAGHILKIHQENTVPYKIDPELLRKYIAYARKSVQPTLTDEAAKVLQDFYVTMRSGAIDDESPVPITARQLEALVRLAEASARIRLSNDVLKEDAERAIRLQENCMKQVGYDPDTGKVDIDKVEGRTPKSERDKFNIVTKVIKELEDEYDGFAPRNVLYLKLSDDHNIEEPDAEKFINILKSKGVIFEPTPDKFKTT